MLEKLKKIENRALTIGMVANLFMAVSGWFTFYLSNSEAMLLDANFSFIIFLSSIVALEIAKVKGRETDAFPYGLYVIESLYSLTKGLLIGGLLLAAITGNLIKIIDYFTGAELPVLKTDAILVYAVVMAVVCFSLSLYYYLMNRKVNNESSMLGVEQSSAIIDGVMSAGTGIALLLIGQISIDSSFSFLLYIGDALMVLLLASLMIKQPVQIIRSAFFEIAGGRLQDKLSCNNIEKNIDVYLQEFNLEKKSFFVNRTGSCYFVAIEVSIDRIKVLKEFSIVEVKDYIQSELRQQYSNIYVEFILV